MGYGRQIRQIPLSVGLVGNAAVIHPELVKRNYARHCNGSDPCSRSDVVCASGRVKELDSFKGRINEFTREKVLDAIVDHLECHSGYAEKWGCVL